jgi:hypothetical protein
MNSLENLRMGAFAGSDKRVIEQINRRGATVLLN